MLPFSPVIKNGKINTQLLFSKVNIQKFIEPCIFYLFAGKPFALSSVNYNDVNLEENWKLNVATDFQIFLFRNKNWSIDRIPSDKSTKRGGPKCRSAQEGKGKGVGTLSGKEGGRSLLLVHANTGIIWPRRVCAAEQVVDIWITGSWQFHCLASLTWCRLKKGESWRWGRWVVYMCGTNN